VSDASDIDSSGGNIGCHKYLNLLTLERLQGSLPGVLRFIAVNCRGFDPTLEKPLSKVVRSPFGLGKHQSPLDSFQS
jgi:hypothetical protein